MRHRSKCAAQPMLRLLGKSSVLFGLTNPENPRRTDQIAASVVTRKTMRLCGLCANHFFHAEFEEFRRGAEGGEEMAAFRASSHPNCVLRRELRG